MAKYMVLFSLTGETMKRFVAKPSDRAAVVQQLAEWAGGSIESYYWMFGQYDGAGVFVLPDSHTMAAVSLRPPARAHSRVSDARTDRVQRSDRDR